MAASSDFEETSAHSAQDAPEQNYREIQGFEGPPERKLCFGIPPHAQDQEPQQEEVYFVLVKGDGFPAVSLVGAPHGWECYTKKSLRRLLSGQATGEVTLAKHEDTLAILDLATAEPATDSPEPDEPAP